MDNSTQEAMIYAFLKNGHKLTPVDALRLFGCFRLAARVYDLRRKGFAIESEIVRQGKRHWSKYFILSNGGDCEAS